ncbi:hypothetical protein ACIQBJ_16115 [Kitasatospora sp. NPDC088391]|uniref:hypothetical protein n=1 Tax=Kitasatospora sp. NPDC088391 TaxID=3364074 RepID=UPI00380C2469
MLFGSRGGFGLEFRFDQDPGLLCVDVFVGGLRVNARDNAFYPPLLVKKLGDEAGRHREPAAPPDGFTTPAESYRRAEQGLYDEAGPGDRAEPARCAFLEWGECTDDVLAFAFPDGDRLHLACRLRADGGPAWGTGPRHGPTVATVDRAAFVATLDRARAAAAGEWSARLTARLAARPGSPDGTDPA